MSPRIKILLLSLPLAALVALSVLLKSLHSNRPTPGQSLLAATEGRLPIRQNAIPLFDYSPPSPPPTLASANLPDLTLAPALDPTFAPPNTWFFQSKTLAGQSNSPPFFPQPPTSAPLIAQTLNSAGYFEPQKLLLQTHARALARPAHTQFKNWLFADTPLLQRATSLDEALDTLLLLTEPPPIGPVLTFPQHNLTWYCWATPDPYNKNKSLYRLVAFAPDGSQSFDARWFFTNSPPDPEPAQTPSLAPARAWLIANLIHQNSLLTRSAPTPPAPASPLPPTPSPSPQTPSPAPLPPRPPQ